MRPAIEAIERRLLMSVVTVTLGTDTGSGSLRYALAIAAPGDTIDFDPSVRDINLNSAGLTLTQNVTIVNDQGVGPVTVNGGGKYTVFTVNSGVTASITGVTLTDGYADQGGAVNNRGTLTLTNDTLSASTAAEGAGAWSNGTLTLNGCTVSGNSLAGAGQNFAGGIVNEGGTLTITNSTIANNTGEVGGIANVGGTIGNTTTTIIDSTITGNTGTLAAGGILTLDSSEPGVKSSLTLQDSIVSGNTGGDGAEIAQPGSTVTDNGHNLLGNSSETSAQAFYGFSPAATDLVETSDQGNVALAAIVSSTLANNGGPTQTLALPAGSPAITAGVPVNDPSTNTPITTDQRGVTRPTSKPDIGAYEATPAGSLIVTSTSDAANATGNTLREAINYANTLSGPQTVTFAASLTASGPAVITLSSGLIDITNSVTITGPGADLLSISGGGSGENGIDVNDNSTTEQTVAITGLTLTDSDASQSFLYNAENLTLSGDVISNNLNGGIQNYGTLTSSGNTFSGNSKTAGGGGAIDTERSLNSTNDTFSGNSAPSGGAISVGENASFANDTITQNAAIGSGASGFVGGVLAGSGTVNLANTIIAGNTATQAEPDVYGLYTSNGHNLIGDGTGGFGFAASDQVGTTAAPINAMLGTLGNYGGPTPTVPLLAGSPAIGAGVPVDYSGTTTPVTTDQRGLARPGTSPDIGAYQTGQDVISGTDYLEPSGTTAASLTTSTTGTPVVGTSITLTGTDVFGVAVNLTATTNASGVYTFPAQNPSNGAGYTLTETPPSADTHLGQTSTTAGAVTTPASTPIVSNLVLSTNGSTSTDNFFEVSPAPTPAKTVIHTADDGGVYNGKPFPATGYVAGPDGKPVATPTFLYYLATDTKRKNPLPGAPSNAGQYFFTATFAGNSNYLPSSTSAPFTIARASTVIHAADHGGVANGKPYPATGYVAGVGGASIATPVFTYYLATDTHHTSPLRGAPSAVGSYTFLANYAGSANYLPSVTSAPFKITKS